MRLALDSQSSANGAQQTVGQGDFAVIIVHQDISQLSLGTPILYLSKEQLLRVLLEMKAVSTRGVALTLQGERRGIESTCVRIARKRQVAVYDLAPSRAVDRFQAAQDISVQIVAIKDETASVASIFVYLLRARSC